MNNNDTIGDVDIMDEEQTNSTASDEENLVVSDKRNPEKGINIEYGDIIEIIAPTNPYLHENTFFVNYIDETKIKVINIASKEFIQLNLDTKGFTDKSITQVHLLDRSTESGFARQKGLLPRVWIDIYFRGLPTVTGEITNLEEDQIEITTYPDLQILYIDFSYRGIPENIPIEKFVIREKPRELDRVSSLKKLQERIANGESDEFFNEEEDDDATKEFLPNGESVIHIPESAEPDMNIAENLRNETAKKRGIVYEEYLDKVSQFVEVRESERRYTIELQTTSLMDELLSTIPYSQRTTSVLTHIHILIERYRELRQIYSTTDDNGHVKYLRIHDATMHKPLVQHIQQMDVCVPWLLPIVALKKKLYEDDDEPNPNNVEMPDAVNLPMSILLDEEEMKGSAYYKNVYNMEQNKYATMHSQLNSFMTPFEEPDDPNMYLRTLRIKTRLEAIVETVPPFKCPIYHGETDSPGRTDFFLQVYSDKVKGSGQGQDNEMMPADKMTIKSLLMLPDSMIKYSRVFQQKTSILARVNLHHTRSYPFLFLNKRATIQQTPVEDYSREIVYDDETSGKQPDQQSKKPLNYLSSTAITRFDPASEYNSFNKFLFSVLPNTKTVLTWIRRELETNRMHYYSVYEIVQLLEPFMIYESDIMYAHYNSIRFFIKEKIPLLTQVLEENRKIFKQYRNEVYQTDRLRPLLTQLLLENKELLTQFLAVYSIASHDERSDKRAPNSSHEILNQVRLADGGNVFAKILASLMSVLVTPNPLIPLEDIPTDEFNEKADACQMRTLAKKYDSLVDLEKDNGTESVFFDKDLDDTPYDLLKPYEKEQQEMAEDKFLPYFAENLVQKHGIEREKAELYAEQIIAGRRRVKDGQYALLEIEPKLMAGIDEGSLNSKEKGEIESELEVRKQTDYYIRKKTQWIKDSYVDYLGFMDDVQLFCNWSDLTKRRKNKSGKNKSGENKDNDENDEENDLQNRRQVLQEKEKERVRKEFDRRYDANREVFEANINKDLLRTILSLVGKLRIRHINEYYANNLAYELGKIYAIQSGSNGSDANNNMMQSPYLELRYKIVDDPDFVEKQKNIVRFVDKFCREPLVEAMAENPFWKYCKETNTKLMPAFLYTLAQEFCTFGQQAYLAKMNQLIALQGYQEGNAIYDKHSDEWIRNIDNVEEEGYTEEGFRIITNAVMEDDLQTKVMNRLSQPFDSGFELNDPIFENRTQQEIHQIFTKFSTHFSKMSPDTISDIRRISFSICEREIKSESLYEKDVEKQRAKGKKAMSYDDMRNRQMIFIVVSVTFAFMQTAIPNFRPSRTSPSCVFSLDGFPLTGEEDTLGIKYLACILKKMATDNAPWNTIYQKKESWLVQNLVEMSKTVAAWPSVEYMYEKKREYMQKNQQEYAAIPREYSINRWQHFLPPIVKTDANKHVTAVSASLINEFWGMAQKGAAGQTGIVFTIRGKMANYGYAIIEFIQQVVKSKELIMKTMSKVPFMQNACCNDTDNGNTNPIRYFASQENGDNFGRYIQILAKLSGEIYRIQLVSQPRTLAFPMTYRLSPRLVADETELIYAAMIHYCKLDRGDIPVEFHRFFSEVPVGYNATASLESKIAFLREHRKFTDSDLALLMTIVRRKNGLHASNIQTGSVDVAIRFLNVLELHPDKVLVEHIRQVLEEKEKDQEKKEEKKEKEALLRDYLYDTNSMYFMQIAEFMRDHGNLKETELEKLVTFLARMDIWNIDQKDPAIIDPSVNHDRVLLFLKNMVFDLTHYLPSIILNQHSGNAVSTNYYPSEDDNTDNIRIHKYWELSDADKNALYKIIQSHYSQIYSLKEEMSDFFSGFRDHLINMYLFITELPYRHLFDRELLYMFSMNAVYSTIVMYIENVNPVQMKMKGKESQTTPDDDGFEFDEEVDIDVRDKDEIEETNVNVAKLLQVFLNIHMNNKKYLDYDYKSVTREIVKNNEAEKERIMSGLEQMEKPERRVENLAKQYKLGKWSVGNQKGIFVYDKATSDRERAENLQQGIHDLPYSELDREPAEYNPGQNQIDVDELAAEQEEEWDREQQDEMDAFPRMEGYLDGGFYEEDGEDDFENQDF
jgi:hypothetical protein